MGPSGVERRRFPRRKCGLPAEVKTAENRYPWRGETTDVSVGGCYVMLPFVLPVGTEATISLWIDGNKLDAQCTVKTADPGVGIGVQFENITEEQRKLLSDRLDREETAPDSELLIVR